MATVDAAELAKIRRKMSKDYTDPPWEKPAINAAIQALEDWYEGERATVNAALNAATSPLTLTAEQKKKLVGYFLIEKAVRELI